MKIEFNFNEEKRKLMREWAESYSFLTFPELLERIEKLEEEFVEKLKEEIVENWPKLRTDFGTGNVNYIIDKLAGEELK